MCWYLVRTVPSVVHYQGVPVRIELGPRDVERGELVAVRRDNAEKLTLKLQSADKSIPELLDQIHESMFTR